MTLPPDVLPISYYPVNGAVIRHKSLNRVNIKKKRYKNLTGEPFCIYHTTEDTS